MAIELGLNRKSRKLMSFRSGLMSAHPDRQLADRRVSYQASALGSGLISARLSPFSGSRSFVSRFLPEIDIANTREFDGFVTTFHPPIRLNGHMVAF